MKRIAKINCSQAIEASNSICNKLMYEARAVSSRIDDLSSSEMDEDDIYHAEKALEVIKNAAKKLDDFLNYDRRHSY